MAHRGDSTQFTTIDRQSEPDFFIHFADEANALADMQGVKRLMRSTLDLQRASHVLDLGCGTGDDARGLAGVLQGPGRVVGLDFSAVMIAEAIRRHGAAELDFLRGDAEHLPFADQAFDRCRAERVLMHLARPEQAIAEMVRVLQRGGRVVVFDFDWDTIFVDSRYRETTRKIVRLYSDGIRSSWIGRALPRLLHDAGLIEVTSVPMTVRPPYRSAHAVFDGVFARAVREGALSEQEIALWWRDLKQSDHVGQFHFGFVGFVVAGRKP
jgi:ubiquinone/menaquinone biosynthesis C-methylase UbiE